MQIKAYFENMVFEKNDYHVLCCSTADETAAMVPQRKSFAKKEKYVFYLILRDFEIKKEFDKSKQYVFEGDWKEGKYGRQFDAYSCEIDRGRNKNEIIAYLTEFDGVGKVTAEKIYEKFGGDTLDVIKNDINKLYQINMSKARVDKIVASFNAVYGLRKAIGYFKKFSLPLKKIRTIYEKYKETAILTMQTNPFEISSSGCISFVEANSVAMDLGVELNSGSRQKQALIYIIETYFRPRGHLFHSLEAVVDLTWRFLNKNIPENKQIEKSSIFACLAELDNKDVKIYGKYVYLIKDLFAEQKTAELLVDFVSYQGNLFNLDKAESFREIADAEKKFGIKLNEDQKAAVAVSMNSNVSIITGGPGTGKTTLLKFILEIFRQNFSNNIRLCSPTGKAARRMAESTGFKSASTIHSLLGIEQDYQWSLESTNTLKIDADLLIIDESSMLDMELAYLLLASIPFTCKVVFLGDVDQLPSVGPGNVLKELISSHTIPTTILGKIYRQSEQSNIVKNAYLFNSGQAEKLIYDTGKKVSDSFVIRPPAENINEQIAKIFCNSLKRGTSIENIQILTPYRTERVNASSYHLNKIIQSLVNPTVSKDDEILCGKITFRKGDRVIQQRNTDNVKNGDVGIITSVNYIKGCDPSVTIDFGEENIVEYTFNEMEENKIDLAYALTVHKSQGSEYKTVIMPCISKHEQMLTRKLVYTAWTRAKEHIIIVGSKDVISAAANNTHENIRNTILAKRIIHEAKKKISKT